MINKLLKVINVLLWDFSQLKNLAIGVAVTIEHKSIISNLEISTLVDVGANKGQFSLLAKGINPEIKIFAFEPLKDARDKFSKIFLNEPDVVLHPYAIGEAVSKEDIHISKKQDSSSLLPIGELQSSIFPGTEESHTETINVCRLDTMISRTDLSGTSLLKIDVQGFEMSVLKGSTGLLAYFDYIYVECSYVELYEGQALAGDIIHFLLNNGYQLKGNYNTSYDQMGIAVQSDFLFRRESS